LSMIPSVNGPIKGKVGHRNMLSQAIKPALFDRANC
jgi:hypothetical protein